MKSALGRCEMHIRHVEWEGGGARGLGFGLALRLGYQGSSRLRRFVMLVLVMREVDDGGVEMGVKVLVWERRTRVGAGTLRTYCLGWLTPFAMFSGTDGLEAYVRNERI